MRLKTSQNSFSITKTTCRHYHASRRRIYSKLLVMNNSLFVDLSFRNYSQNSENSIHDFSLIVDLDNFANLFENSAHELFVNC